MSIWIFPGATLPEKIEVKELNYIFLNSMPDKWSKQFYVQYFYCKSITFKKVNLFEHMDFEESIYEGVL